MKNSMNNGTKIKIVKVEQLRLTSTSEEVEICANPCVWTPDENVLRLLVS